MKQTNLYPGIYKVIAVIVCLMLYATITKAKACGTTTTGQYKTETKLFTNP